LLGRETNVTDRENRIARTQSLFRNVNERIAATSERAGTRQTDIVCECPDPECTARVEVALTEYDGVRGQPTRFLVKPGHEDDSIARVVHRRRGYEIVEKVTRAAARVARQLDPRAAEPA
jgi:hypothetical protein